MTSLSDATGPTMPLQLIDDKMMFRWQDVPLASGSARERTNYNVVAILGSQGSGSSTLLNDIFETNFSTRESPFEATTKGIQSSWSCDSNILILDAQGYPGGTLTGPEKQVAQFITATSDCILLNLKQYEVANLAHTPQYQTVMDTICRMALDRYDEHDSQRKAIVLLYVIRDCDGRIDTNATSILTQGIMSIWRTIVETVGPSNALLSDYLHLRVTNLPHRVHDRDEYQKQVVLLRERFKIGSSDSLVQEVARSDVPLGDVFDHMSSIWKSIRGHVNISSERRAFAEKRCPLFVNSAFKISKRDIELKLNDNMAPEDFKKLSTACQVAGLTDYDARASAYARDVVQSYRKKLTDAVDAELLNRYRLHVKGSHSLALMTFKERLSSLQRKIPSMASEALSDEIDKIKRDSLKEFKDWCNEAKVHPTWNYDEQERLLGSEMDSMIDSVKAKQGTLIKPPPDLLQKYLLANTPDLHQMVMNLVVDSIVVGKMAAKLVLDTVGVGVMVVGAVGNKLAALFGF